MMDARDRLTALLLVTRRKTGIRIDEGRFVPTVMAASLADAIRDVREDIRALDGQLAACEKQARGERSAAESVPVPHPITPEPAWLAPDEDFLRHSTETPGSDPGEPGPAAPGRVAR